MRCRKIQGVKGNCFNFITHNFCTFRVCHTVYVGSSSFEPDVQTTAWPHKISGQVLSSHSIVSQFRTVRPYSPWEGRWIGHWRTTWSTVCSAPHSQAAEEAIPRMYKQERKIPTPVRRGLNRTQALLGRVTPGGWVRVSGMKMRSLVGFPSTPHPIVDPPSAPHDVVVKWTDEMLCGGYNWVSRFEASCVWTRSRVPKPSLIMYAFSISTDGHVPFTFLMTKRLSKITKIHWMFNRTSRFLKLLRWWF